MQVCDLISKELAAIEARSLARSPGLFFFFFALSFLFRSRVQGFVRSLLPSFFFMAGLGVVVVGKRLEFPGNR